FHLPELISKCIVALKAPIRVFPLKPSGRGKAGRHKLLLTDCEVLLQDGGQPSQVAWDSAGAEQELFEAVEQVAIGCTAHVTSFLLHALPELRETSTHVAGLSFQSLGEYIQTFLQSETELFKYLVVC
ncbi:hypothetical protein EGW08_007490, partial [Elysia chlorotica]